jgi:hypothetical protein
MEQQHPDGRCGRVSFFTHAMVSHVIAHLATSPKAQYTGIVCLTGPSPTQLNTDST